MSSLISSSYSFVTMDFRSGEEDLLYRIRFKLDSRGATLDEVYCQDKSRAESLRLTLGQKKLSGFEELPAKDLPWADDIRKSIEQADALAAICVNCTAGDDYHPGRFSKISIHDDRIELEQINHMNAKSLAHKNNYSLRSLEFIIPLSGELRAPGLEEYKIGRMLIGFSDSSSENNRQYGKSVREELERLSEKL